MNPFSECIIVRRKTTTFGSSITHIHPLFLTGPGIESLKMQRPILRVRPIVRRVFLWCICRHLCSFRPLILSSSFFVSKLFSTIPFEAAPFDGSAPRDSFTLSRTAFAFSAICSSSRTTDVHVIRRSGTHKPCRTEKKSKNCRNDRKNI